MSNGSRNGKKGFAAILKHLKIKNILWGVLCVLVVVSICFAVDSAKKSKEAERLLVIKQNSEAAAMSRSASEAEAAKKAAEEAAKKAAEEAAKKAAEEEAAKKAAEEAAKKAAEEEAAKKAAEEAAKKAAEEAAKKAAEEAAKIPPDAVAIHTQRRKQLTSHTGVDKKAWIYIPNTGIDNAVVQSYDNDYYLRRTDTGIASTGDLSLGWYGCYFFDYRVANIGSRTSMSPNSVIYGHSFGDKYSYYSQRFAQFKFSTLNYFRDQAFAQKNPYIFITTPTENLTYQIFALSTVRADYDYLAPNQDIGVLASNMKKLSLYNFSDVQVSSNDKVLTLSACVYNTFDGVALGYPNNYRLVIMAKLLPEDAKLSATHTVTYNSARVNVNSIY